MEFKKSYFDSGKEFNKKKGLYAIKERLPVKDYFKTRSEKHYNLILMEKWKLLKDCKRVLDAGCGRGQFIKLNPFNIQVAGVDVIKSETDLAKKEGLNVWFADITKKIPFKDSNFDGLICSHVLEHLENPEKAFSEFKRVLVNNGTLVIAVPNFSFKQFYKDPTHKRPYPREALYRILMDNGFTDVKIINGPGLNQLVSGVLFPFPKVRHFVEKSFGNIKPWEILAIAKNQK